MKWAIPPSPISAKTGTLSEEDTQSSDNDLKIDEGGSTSQDESSKEDNGEEKTTKRRKSLSGGDTAEEGIICN